MREVTQQDITRALINVGIKQGDNLFIHSALQYLGKPVGGIKIYYQALRDILGEKGTIAVPTFTFSFAKGKSYDPKTSPSIGMGAFSEFVRTLPDAKRSPHPMQSIAAIGYYADDITKRDTPSAFDPGSSFERILELNFKILLLGANIDAVSLYHYCEQRIGVPYRFWKDFEGKLKTEKGWETRTYPLYARYLDLDPRLTLQSVQQLLEKRKQWRSTSLNYGIIAACQSQDFVSAVNYYLEKDPWAFVINKEIRAELEKRNQQKSQE